jgi:hypothetical protein
MSEDLANMISIFSVMQRLDLCVYWVYDSGGHSGPSLIVLPKNAEGWRDYKIV